MDIFDSSKLMINGIACQKDVKIDFQIGKYGRNEYLILLIVRQGVASLEVNFIKYELKENSIMTLVPKSNIRCIECSDDFCCSFLVFDRDFALEAIPRPEPAYMDFIRSYPLGMMLQHRVEPIQAGFANIEYFLYRNEGHHRMQIVKNIVQAMLLELYDVIKLRFMENLPKTVNRQNELFMQFIHLVYKYGDKQREVTFFADKLCITTRYLASIVKNIAHETAKDVIDRHCVQEIKTLLRTTNLSIQGIAIELEFPNQSFFTRYFKKLTGMTPKEFRALEG